MKTIHSLKLKPKTILLGVLLLCLNTLLPAQNLYVQPIGVGEQEPFELAQKPKITFNSRNMAIETPTANKVYVLNEIRNLSFIKQIALNANIVMGGDKIRLYPNPVKDELELNIQIPTHDLTYRIYDMSGSLLKTEKIRSATTKINVENYEAGTYIFRLDQKGKELQSFKIVKQ